MRVEETATEADSSGMHTCFHSFQSWRVLFHHVTSRVCLKKRFKKVPVNIDATVLCVL